MDIHDLNSRGLVILGCGKMGSAMLAGWLDRGLAPGAVTVMEPHPSDWLRGTGVRLAQDPPEAPAALVVAVKPQVMDAALPSASSMGGGATLVVSVAAGTSLDRLAQSFAPGTPIIRAMPNTPAAIGRGISAMIGNASATAAHLDLAEALLSAVGRVVRLEDEAQIDAVTGLSGSGPAYVFHMIEAMAAAGEAEGLPADMAMELAIATVAGAGALAERSGDSVEQLRINVTSPNGTTAAGLAVLMDELPDLMRRTVAAATARSRELKG